MEMIINLIIQLISGAAGGNAARAALIGCRARTIGVTMAGAVGGVIGGQALQILIPEMAGTRTGELDLGSVLAQLLGGSISGAILTAIVILAASKAIGSNPGLLDQKPQNFQTGA